MKPGRGHKYARRPGYKLPGYITRAKSSTHRHYIPPRLGDVRVSSRLRRGHPEHQHRLPFPLDAVKGILLGRRASLLYDGWRPIRARPGTTLTGWGWWLEPSPLASPISGKPLGAPGLRLSGRRGLAKTKALSSSPPSRTHHLTSQLASHTKPAPQNPRPQRKATRGQLPLATCRSGHGTAGACRRPQHRPQGR